MKKQMKILVDEDVSSFDGHLLLAENANSKETYLQVIWQEDPINDRSKGKGHDSQVCEDRKLHHHHERGISLLHTCFQSDWIGRGAAQ